MSAIELLYKSINALEYLSQANLPDINGQNFMWISVRSSEMHFLPRPGGSIEDDGVLVTIVFDGPKEQVDSSPAPIATW